MVQASAGVGRRSLNKGALIVSAIIFDEERNLELPDAQYDTGDSR